MKIKVTGLKSLNDLPPGKFYFIMRPLVKNVPSGRPGWVQVQCPHCHQPCWKTRQEPDPLPTYVAAACTRCALEAGAAFNSTQKDGVQ